MRQLELFKQKSPREFGGTLNVHKRKSFRPLDFQQPTHLVLKASSADLLLENQSLIKSTIINLTDRFGIRVYSLAIQADHIHLNLYFGNRTLYLRWIRSATGILTRRIPNLEWKFSPYTRIGRWGRDFKNVQKYIAQNEATGQFLSSALERVEYFRRMAVDEMYSVV